jgi:vancomycin resistance protein YoaR
VAESGAETGPAPEPEADLDARPEPGSQDVPDESTAVAAAAAGTGAGKPADESRRAPQTAETAVVDRVPAEPSTARLPVAGSSAAPDAPAPDPSDDDTVAPTVAAAAAGAAATSWTPDAPASATPPSATAPVRTSTRAGSATPAPPQTGPAAPTAAAPTAAAPAAAAATAAVPSAAVPSAAVPTATVPTAAAPAAAAAATAETSGAAPQAVTPLRVTGGPVTPTPRKESPLDVFEPDAVKRTWPKRLAIVGGILVLLLGGYVAASFALADTVPRGATVAGVEIGGLSSADAVARLEDELHAATTEPIEVVANDVTSSIDPQDAGLELDAQATVEELTGASVVEPGRLWDHLIGVGESEPVTVVDHEALHQSVDGLEDALSKAPVDGSIVFVDGTAQATDAVEGWKLDVEGAEEVIEADWLTGARPLDLPTEVVEPEITQAETDAALALASRAVSGPVSVTIDDKLSVLTPQDVATAASMVPVDGNLVLTMDGEKLADDILEQQPKLLTKASDAKFEFKDGEPVLVKGKPGTSIDEEALATAVATAATASARNADVKLVEKDPKNSTAELKKLGIKEIVSEFSTPLTSEPRRTENIRTGLEHITGTLIRPGETFSLTEALGPVDAEHGFIDAGAIVAGEHVQAIGGGLSQVSTTTYNAAFFAGMADVEHTPHSEWFARYPEGREATIFTGVIDMKWKNNTPYGALVQGWVADGRTYVRIWGTKHWTVDTTTSPRSGVVAPTTVYSQSPTCEPALAGNPGFSVTVTRKTYLGDDLKKTESNSWRYKPQNKVVCGEPPDADADAP